MVITVTQPPLKVMSVNDLAMSVSFASTTATATAKVMVKDQSGTPVPNATVTGNWSGLVRGTATGITGTDGTVAIRSAKTKKSGVFTFTVTTVAASGYSYDASRNIETADSISTTSVGFAQDGILNDEAQGTLPSMGGADILMDLDVSMAGSSASATVQVIDEQGNPVKGTVVTGQWSGLVAGAVSGITDVLGQATFISGRMKQAGQFIFTVTGMTLPGYSYDVENSVTEKSIDNDY